MIASIVVAFLLMYQSALGAFRQYDYRLENAFWVLVIVVLGFSGILWLNRWNRRKNKQFQSDSLGG